MVTANFLDNQKKIQAVFFDKEILKSKTLVAGLSINDLSILIFLISYLPITLHGLKNIRP